jgi:CheY-like chemotaxis protein
MTSSDHGRTQGRILAADDDLVAGRFLTRLPGDRGGFDVTHAAGPAAALKRAGHETWDPVLTGAEMPGVTVRQVAA